MRCAQFVRSKKTDQPPKETVDKPELELVSAYESHAQGFMSTRMGKEKGLPCRSRAAFAAVHYM